jgi:hypothetical protein
MRLNIHRLSGIASIALGAGTAAGAILGPLVTNVIRFHVSENARNQLIGGEIISLCVAAPLAIGAGVLWLRHKPLAPKLAIGPALYALYANVQFSIGPEYQRYPGNNEYAIPLNLVLIILGWAVAVRAWTELGAAEEAAPLSNRVRRGLAALLIVLPLFFALTWIRGIAQVIGGERPTEYLQDPTLFWLVRLMDLAFVIPAALVEAVGLLRRTEWATRLGYATTGFLALEVAAVGGMAGAMLLHDDPSASRPLLVVMLAGTVMLVTAFVLLLRNGQPGPAGQQRHLRQPTSRRAT